VFAAAGLRPASVQIAGSRHHDADRAVPTVARTIGLVEDRGHRKGVKFPFQGTIATTDGERTWVFRYSSEGKSRSLFFSTDVPTLRKLYPERQRLREFSEDARLVVSEPLVDLPGAWNEVPESSYGVIGKGEDQLLPFAVRPPSNGARINA
jgi:hypothetical protein